MAKGIDTDCDDATGDELGNDIAVTLSLRPRPENLSQLLRSGTLNITRLGAGDGTSGLTVTINLTNVLTVAAVPVLAAPAVQNSSLGYSVDLATGRFQAPDRFSVDLVFDPNENLTRATLDIDGPPEALAVLAASSTTSSLAGFTNASQQVSVTLSPVPRHIEAAIRTGGSENDVDLEWAASAVAEATFALVKVGERHDNVTAAFSALPRNVTLQFRPNHLRYEGSSAVGRVSAFGNLGTDRFQAEVQDLATALELHFDPAANAVNLSAAQPLRRLTYHRQNDLGLGCHSPGMSGCSDYRTIFADLVGVPTRIHAAVSEQNHTANLSASDTIGNLLLYLATSTNPSEIAANLSTLAQVNILYRGTLSGEFFGIRLPTLREAGAAFGEQGNFSARLRSAGGFPLRASYAKDADWAHLNVSDVPADMTVVVQVSGLVAFTGTAPVSLVDASGVIRGTAFSFSATGLPTSVRATWAGHPGGLVGEFSNSDVLGSLTVRASARAGIFGTRYTQALFAVQALPASGAFHIDGGSRRVNLTFSDHAGALEALLANGTALTLPGDHVYYHRVGANESISARITGLKSVNVTLGDNVSELRMSVRSTSPFEGRYESGADWLRVNLTALPASVSATFTALPRLRLDSQASGPLEAMEADGEFAGTAFSLRAMGVPESIALAASSPGGSVFQGTYNASGSMESLSFAATAPGGLYGTPYNQASFDLAGLPRSGSLRLDGTNRTFDLAWSAPARRMQVLLANGTASSLPGDHVYYRKDARGESLSARLTGLELLNATLGNATSRVAVRVDGGFPFQGLFQTASDWVGFNLSALPRTLNLNLTAPPTPKLNYSASQGIAELSAEGNVSGTAFEVNATQVPTAMQFAGGAAGPGGFQGTFTNSAALGSLTVSATNPRGVFGTRFTQAWLGLQSLPASGNVSLDGVNRTVKVEFSDRAGSVEAYVANGTVWSLPGDHAYYRNVSGAESLSARITALRSLNATLSNTTSQLRAAVDSRLPFVGRFEAGLDWLQLDLGPLPSTLNATFQSSPGPRLNYSAASVLDTLSILGNVSGTSFSVSAAKVPSSLSLNVSATARGVLNGTYAASASMDSLVLDASSTSGVFNTRFTQVYLEVADLPASGTIGFDAGNRSVNVRFSDHLGTLRGYVANGTAYTLPGDHAYYRNASGSEYLSARVTGLKALTASWSNVTSTLNLTTNSSAPFQGGLDTGTDRLTVALSTLPNDFNVSFTAPPQPRLAYAASSVVGEFSAHGNISGTAFTLLAAQVPTQLALNTSVAGRANATFGASYSANGVLQALTLSAANPRGVFGSKYSTGFLSITNLPPTGSLRLDGENRSATVELDGHAGLVEARVAQGSSVSLFGDHFLFRNVSGAEAMSLRVNGLRSGHAVLTNTTQTVNLSLLGGRSFTGYYQRDADWASLSTTALPSNINATVVSSPRMQLNYRASAPLQQLSTSGNLSGTSFSLFTEQLPSAVDFSVASAGVGVFQGNFSTSAPLPTFRVQASNALGVLGTRYQQLFLGVDELPLSGQFRLDGSNPSFNLSLSSHARSIQAFAAKGGVHLLPGDHVYYRAAGANESISAKITGLKSLSATLGADRRQISATVNSALPFEAVYQDGAKYLDITLSNLPATASLSLDLPNGGGGRGSFSYAASAPIRTVEAVGTLPPLTFALTATDLPLSVSLDWTNSTSLGATRWTVSGRTTGSLSRLSLVLDAPNGLPGLPYEHADFLVRSVPGSVTFNAVVDQRDSTINFDSGNVPLGLVEVNLHNGNPFAFPASNYAIYYVGNGIATVSGHIEGLINLSASSNPSRTTVTVRGASFLPLNVYYRNNNVYATLYSSRLPSTFQATLTDRTCTGIPGTTTGCFDYVASQPIQDLTAYLNDGAGQVSFLDVATLPARVLFSWYVNEASTALIEFDASSPMLMREVSLVIDGGSDYWLGRNLRVHKASLLGRDHAPSGFDCLFGATKVSLNADTFGGYLAGYVEKPGLYGFRLATSYLAAANWRWTVDCALQAWGTGTFGYSKGTMNHLLGLSNQEFTGISAVLESTGNPYTFTIDRVRGTTLSWSSVSARLVDVFGNVWPATLSAPTGSLQSSQSFRISNPQNGIYEAQLTHNGMAIWSGALGSTIAQNDGGTFVDAPSTFAARGSAPVLASGMYSGALAPTDLDDYYRIDVAPATQVRVALIPPTIVNYDLRVMDSFGSLVVSSVNTSPHMWTEYVDFQSSPFGFTTYYVNVRNCGTCNTMQTSGIYDLMVAI